jgi:hypothetical protein
MSEQVELEISFYCNCSICKGHFHDFEHSQEPTECLDCIEAETDEKNLEETRRKIIRDMERNLYRLQVSSDKRRIDMLEKEDQKKRLVKEGFLYSVKDSSENPKKNVYSARYNSGYYDDYALREEKKWPFKRQHKRSFYEKDFKQRKPWWKSSHI